MGTQQSHDDRKTVDAAGEVINNVIVQEPVAVHGTDKVVILLTILCILKSISLIMYIYGCFVKQLKKKYMGNTQNA